MYEEACNVATTVDMGYHWEGEFILLAIVIGGNKYMELTNKVYVEPTELPSYNALINKGTSDYHQEKKSAEHEVFCEAWAMYIGTNEGISKNIQYALYLPYYD